MAGGMKLLTPMDELVSQMPASAEIPVGLVRFIGLSEVLAGLGLILPSALRILPGLTPLAAVGLIVVMLLAAGYHLSKGEFSGIAVNALFAGAAAFIAWARYVKFPITSRAHKLK